MGRRKNRRIVVPELEILDIADKGKSMGRDAQGRVVFVENLVPGDVADILILRKKSKYMTGVPLKIHKLSEDRVEPFCQHFESCGGCKWQHITYEAQIRHKEKVVRDAMSRIAKIEIKEFLPILPALETTYYRNKMEYAFSNKKWLPKELLNSDVSNLEDVLGFHPSGAYDKIIDIEHCHLQGGISNDLRNKIKQIAIDQGLSFHDAKVHEGFMRHILIRTSSLGETMVIVSFYEDLADKITTFLDEVLRQFPEITTLCYCVNPKVNDYILDLEMPVYHGKGYIEEKLRDVRFRIGPKSFFQTNTGQAERLYDVVVDFADLKGTENVYDLYTGIGSIGLYIAKNCRQVVGIEEVTAAIEDAHVNAQLNEIENCVFYAGDVKDILTAEFAEKHGKPDLLITDPPRAGMHIKVVEMLLQLEVPRMIYVSCNPATQARDLENLSAKYNVIKMRPVDMFPHTHHIENVALLEIKTPAEREKMRVEAAAIPTTTLLQTADNPPAINEITPPPYPQG